MGSRAKVFLWSLAPVVLNAGDECVSPPNCVAQECQGCAGIQLNVDVAEFCFSDSVSV